MHCPYSDLAGVYIVHVCVYIYIYIYVYIYIYTHTCIYSYVIATFGFNTYYTALPQIDLIRYNVALYNKYFTGDFELMFKFMRIKVSKVDFAQILEFCIHNRYILYDNKIF